VSTNKHQLPSFLGDSLPVELVAELRDVALDGSGVVLTCGTQRFRLLPREMYGTIVETPFEPPTPGKLATVRLDFLTPEIVRVRYAPGPGVPANETPMVVGAFEKPVLPRLGEQAGAVTLESDAVHLIVRREPWRLELCDSAGALIWATRALDLPALRLAEDGGLMEWWERWQFLVRYAYPLGLSDAPDGPCAFASFELRHDEHVYGFGESFGHLDKRETRRMLWLQEAFGNASPASYKQVPFFMTTRGYGLFVNTSHGMVVHVGELDHTALSIVVEDAAFLDWYLIYGPSLKEILCRYASITGHSPVPPKWTFGLWMSRISYRSQREVEDVARRLREHRIPCDVIHIDTGWFEREWECDFEFSPTRFPDPAGMVRRLGEQGFRVSLWQWPHVFVGSAMYIEAEERGYLVRRRDGRPYTYSGFGADVGLLDYSNPEAVAWVQGKLRRLFDLGVAAIKADFGEGAPEDGVYEGAGSAEMHNLYPLLYSRAIFEATVEGRGEGQGVTWTRAAWAGSQRYPVHWSGDGLARHEDLACVLRSALSVGLSGFPFYSHDIGGFMGIPAAELYVRWAQLGLLSSHARCHGLPPREPWAFGQRAEEIFRRYAELRYRLIPYIYSEAVECARSGQPIVRALVLDYQEDPTTHTIDDQYLFGRDMLVAPILDAGNSRRLYLPQGQWMDYWTGEKLDGGRWIRAVAPLEVVPLYVRAGSIVPFGPLMQHVDERPCDPLTVAIYAPTEGHRYLIHDEDRPDIDIAYRRDGDEMSVRIEGSTGLVELRVHGVIVTGATADGSAIPVQTDDEGVAVLLLEDGLGKAVTLQLARA